MIFGIIPPYTNHLISVKTVIPGQIHWNPIFQTYGYGSIPIFIPFLVGYSHPF